MTSAPRRTAMAVLPLVAALLLGASLAPALAFAQEEPARPAPVQVTLTAQGPTPEFIEVPVGATVVFVNDDSAPHQVTATVEEGKSTPWSYDSGLIAAKDGENRSASSPTPPFETAGRYTFNDARGLVVTETFADEIGVLAPAPAEPPPGEDPPGEQPPPGEDPPGDAGTAPGGEPGASPSPSSGPSGGPQAGGPPPGGAPAPGSAPGAPGAPVAPGPTGGTGTTAPLPLGGGFGSFGSTPAPIPGLDPLAPEIAAPLELAAPPTTQLPDVAAPSPGRAPSSTTALPTGSLPGSVTERAYGLPAALATISILGVLSLLVRVLLAEPVAGRGLTGALPSPPVTA